MAMTIKRDPVTMVKKIFNEKFEGYDCELNVVAGLYHSIQKWGYVNWPQDDSKPVILMDLELPLLGAAEVLMCCLGEVVAGKGNTKSKECKDAMNVLQDAFQDLACEPVDRPEMPPMPGNVVEAEFSRVNG